MYEYVVFIEKLLNKENIDLKFINKKIINDILTEL